MNICSQSATKSKFSLIALLGIGLFAWNQPAIAATAIPGQAIRIDLNDPANGDDTGVKVLNQDSNDHNVSIQRPDNNPFPNYLLPEGFVLLDKTLKVNSTIPAGKRRIRVRMDYGRFDLGRRGIRANTIRLLRANQASRRWIRAEQRIANPTTELKFLRLLRDDDFVLGRHGFDLKKNFAWAVIDTDGDQNNNQYFALAGLAAVPLPAAWLLFLSGSGILLLVSRNRRQTESPR